MSLIRNQKLIFLSIINNKKGQNMQKPLNFISVLLIGASIGSASAVVTEEQGNAAVGGGTKSVRFTCERAIATNSDAARDRAAAAVAAPKLMTLKNVNKLRTTAGVTILFALPQLPEKARPMVGFLKGRPDLKVSKFPINGIPYDLWTNYDSWDLETDGGIARYTFDNGLFTGGDSTKETWHSNYYLTKEGALPRESENALDITGVIPGVEGAVYVLLGEIFHKHADVSYYDNDARRYQQEQVKAARQRALAARARQVAK
jgi:hypothetical protein